MSMLLRALILAAFLSCGTAHAMTQQEACIARAIYWEARGTSEAGQRAVAEVIWNRVNHPSFPKTPCAVVYQQRDGVCQFSWACTHARNVTPRNSPAWQNAVRIARQPPGDLTNGALFFHARRYRARWWHLEEVAQIDDHIFYAIRR